MPKMKIKDIVSYFEEIAPLALQEDYDNSGLQLGNSEDEVERALVCVDCTEEVLDEAIEHNCGLIISHHPLIFGKLKRLTGSDHVQRILAKAITHKIALYAIHTNLDNVIEGVNGRFANVLGLKPQRVVRPMSDRLMKLCVNVPSDNFDQLREALFKAGAGVIGRYSECSFNYPGIGSFKPGLDATPNTGEIGLRHESEELKLEVVLFEWRVSSVLKAMREAHQYEEVAYDLIPLRNEHLGLGSGVVGTFDEPISEKELITLTKERLQATSVRHSSLTGRKIQKVAICGGSGSFLLPDVRALGVDAFITSDLKYHQFQEPDSRFLLIDVGHYETERATIDLIVDLLAEKFPKFALRLTQIDSNPIHYA